MPFAHKTVTYSSPKMPNPFLEGGARAYGDILRDAYKVKNFVLHFVGIGSLLLFAASLFLFFVSLQRQDVVPVLVNVMPSGEAAYLGEVRAGSGGIQVPEAAIRFQVKEFVSNLRSVPVDIQVMNEKLTKCYHAASKAYEPYLTRMIREQGFFSLVGKIRRVVEIESVLRITNSSYQVDWIETVSEANGMRQAHKMRALLTVVTIDPQPDFIETNPLGIFIEDFEWTEL
jgi:type IV secretion system protein TrbF